MDKIKAWLSQTPYSDFDITIASADASFRKYYRLTKNDKTFVLMDSSLEKESLKPFLDVTRRLLAVGAKAPQILEQNLGDGFLVIEDFGSTHYLDVLNHDNFKSLYKNAIDEIVKMQKADSSNLPPYDKEFLTFEMNLMEEWYILKLLPATPNDSQKKILHNCINAISDVVLSQPQGVFVHRDYHSRNIMLTPENEIGIIDYQDAMSGGITYDLASLLEDSYIEFDKEDMRELILYFRDKKGLDVDDETFIKWFDFTSMQRHIKVLGVFARLYIRDGKNGYLKDIPLTLKYLFDTARVYEETKPLHQLLKEL